MPYFRLKTGPIHPHLQPRTDGSSSRECWQGTLSRHSDAHVAVTVHPGLRAAGAAGSSQRVEVVVRIVAFKIEIIVSEGDVHRSRDVLA